MKTIINTTLVLLIMTYTNMVNAVENSKVDAKSIDKMIKVVNPFVNKAKRMVFANQLSQVAKKYNIDPKIMIAIIDTESDFDNTKISNTGDISLAQINLKIWNKELKRLKLPAIDEKKLIKNEAYALSQLARILAILKNRHSNKDRKWFARYHSQTKKYKSLYSLKVELRMRKIASIN
jgi:soluble lytic murein transglycosylase-like protein